MRLGPVAGVAFLAGLTFVIVWPMRSAWLRRRSSPAPGTNPIAGLERNLAIALGGVAAFRAARVCSSWSVGLIQVAVAGAAGYWLANMWNGRQV